MERTELSADRGVWRGELAAIPCTCGAELCRGWQFLTQAEACDWVTGWMCAVWWGKRWSVFGTFKTLIAVI